MELPSCSVSLLRALSEPFNATSQSQVSRIVQPGDLWPSPRTLGSGAREPAFGTWPSSWGPFRANPGLSLESPRLRVCDPRVFDPRSSPRGLRPEVFDPRVCDPRVSTPSICGLLPRSSGAGALEPAFRVQASSWGPYRANLAESLGDVCRGIGSGTGMVWSLVPGAWCRVLGAGCW